MRIPVIHGIINVYKEPGFTSHDVVAKLRGIAKQKKIGHTGTLDPAAEGVLPVCLGSATRVCDMLTEKRKTYRAVMLLGTTTDTQDTTGTVLTEREVSCTEEEIHAVMESFLGDQMQIPPMYSALKVDGKRLYELARAGREVEREARPVTFYDITLREIRGCEVEFDVTCSKGTYIRTLCADMGEKLGCGGCMKALTRTKVDRFELGEAWKLSELEKLVSEGKLMEAVLPVDGLFGQFPAVRTTKEGDKFLYNGNPLTADDLADIPAAGGQTESSAAGQETDIQTENGASGITGNGIRIYDSKGVFQAIYRETKTGEYRPWKTFFSRND